MGVTGALAGILVPELACGQAERSLLCVTAKTPVNSGVVSYDTKRQCVVISMDDSHVDHGAITQAPFTLSKSINACTKDTLIITCSLHDGRPVC